MDPDDPLRFDAPDVNRLLSQAERAGRRTLIGFAAALAARGGGPATKAERLELARAFAATTAAADLLGRYRAVRLAERHRAADTFALDDGREWFALLPGLPAWRPLEALRFFLGLAPSLGLNPQRWGAAVERHAMTLARATETTVVERVQRAIARQLELEPTPDPLARGVTPLTGPEAVRQVLAAAGVNDERGGYSEMAFRTNVNDALNTGFDRQLAHPEMQELFPVWEYMTARDNRVGKDHEPMDGKYYPAHATFAEVRGPRPYNCRCTRRPLTQRQWADLKRGGARLETAWGGFAVAA